MENIWQKLPQPFFVLAPMDDVTDVSFRSVVADCAPPDVFFTEFANVDALQSAGRHAALRRLQVTDGNTPVILQIWGKTPENYAKTIAQIIDGTFAAELGHAKDKQLFAGIDLNMGCPDKTIVNNGCCSALINNRELAGQIITASLQAADGKLPISVKTRLGFNEIDYTWHEFLLSHPISALTVHARTRKEMSKVAAHWEDLLPIIALRDKLAPNVKIIGNGDIASRSHGLELARTIGVDGLMVGRAIFSDPYVFSKHSQWSSLDTDTKIQLYIKHIELYCLYRPDSLDRVEPLKKFCKVYINGFDGASEIRSEFMKMHTAHDMLGFLRNLM